MRISDWSSDVCSSDLDRAWRHRVDRNAAPAEFLRHVPGEHLDRALHRRISSIARIGDAGEPGGKIDDPAAVREQRQQRLGAKEDALDVDVDQPVARALCGFGGQGKVAGYVIFSRGIKTN